MIYSWSQFYLGVDINAGNSWVDFDEGDGVLSFELEYGNYTLTEFCAALASGMNSVGTQTYEVTGNRADRTVTISSENEFTLHVGTGPHGNGATRVAGFTYGERSGSNSYSGTNPAVEKYEPQFKLQSYVPPDLYVKAVDSVKNRSADGRLETIHFGRERFIEMDIKFITNLPMDGTVIKNNPFGLRDALIFLEYISQSKKFEFMPDIEEPERFHKCVLESAPGFGDGTGFKLKELYSQNLPDIYETGTMTLRVVL